jgi:hypothetical protein
MQPATINNNTFVVEGPYNMRIKGEITSDATGKVWTFNPLENLQSYSTYTIMITTSAKAVSGNSLPANFEWSFITAHILAPVSILPVLISAPELTTIVLSPSAANLTFVEGSTLQMSTVSLDQFGAPIDAAITYTSSNPSVATVSSLGIVSLVGSGTTTITASSGAIKDTSIIKTSLIPAGASSAGTSTPPVPGSTPVLTSITLSPGTKTLNASGVNSTQQLTTATLDQFSAPIAATVAYTTSNATVATVNASGFVTAHAGGIATILATSGAVSKTAVITVVSAGAQCAAVLPVDLGQAENFAILSEAGITESLPATGTIVGKIGTSPISGASITGVTCAEITATGGKVYEIDAGFADQLCTVNDGTPGGMLNTAIQNARTAFAAANALAPCVTELGAGDISGMTLGPGVYKWGTTVNVNTDIYLVGNATSVWVFQMAKMFDVANTVQIHLTGGALAKNVFWVANEGVHLGTTSIVNGNILSSGTGGHVDSDPIKLFTGATLNGGAYSWKAVVLQGAHVTNPN